jgi:hypothetical protein
VPQTVERSDNRNILSAGLGGIAFSVLTLIAVIVANVPGGNYSTSQVADYLARGHRVPVIVVFHFALLGLVGLLALLAQLRDSLPSRAASIVWGTGLTAAACFAVGWGIAVGQVIAHLEGGNAIAVSPAVTYLISQIGVVFIFGCGAILLGLTLIVLTMNAKALLPGWLRWFTGACGVAGVAGLAFFTFFLFMLWGLATGLWLLSVGRQTGASMITAEATT